MITFLEYKENLAKKYVCLTFTDETNAKLRQYALDNGFNLTVSYDDKPQKAEDFDFHITVFYTSSEADAKDVGTVDLEPFEVKISGFELLGDENDVPVLLVQRDKILNTIRKEFVFIGYEDKWPDWKPHISLSYQRKQYAKPKKLPNFPIMVNKLSIENQS